MDDADKAKAGTLPADPSADTVRAKPPLRAVAPGEQRHPDAPCAPNAERALLGALLWAGQNAPDTLRVTSVLDIVESGTAFYHVQHGHVFDAIRMCREAKIEHDPVAVHGKLAALGHDQSVGGIDGVRALRDDASTVNESQARHYAQQIKNTWARRGVIREARLLIEDAQSPKTSASDMITKAQSLAASCAENSATAAGSISIKESAVAFFEDIQRGTNSAIPTGLRALDGALNGGLRPGEVSILAARTNVGKSALSSQIAEHMVTSDASMGALYVTLEMSHKMFTARLVASRSGVPINNLRRMVLNPTQMTDVVSTINTLSSKGLYFADNPSQTLAAIYGAAKDRARLLAREGKRLGLVVIDHIGLVKPSAELLRKSNREQQVAETSRAQRVIASDIGCHVLGIAQIHRDAERQQTQSMPKLHHLRESGAIEQDADLVMILHRERDASTGMFRRDKPPALVIAKGRMDETSVMLLDYDGARARFSDWMGPEQYADFYSGGGA